MDSSSPIGIFDSGIGGLTVAHAVTQLLPAENIIYFGDTAHLPYGDKSATSIQAYSLKICNMLMDRGCKLILIACNSASAAAYPLVKEYVGSKATVLNVIDPVVAWVTKHHDGKKVGLIGTKQTVHSKVYDEKIASIQKNITFSSLATPLLVPMIEEGFFKNAISSEIISAYLQRPELENISALILGCTHYPLIKKEIDSIYRGKVDVIDASALVAETVREVLEKQQLLHTGEKGTKKFFVSDYTLSFEESTKLFFKENVHLEHFPIWD